MTEGRGGDVGKRVLPGAYLCHDGSEVADVAEVRRRAWLAVLDLGVLAQPPI